MSRATRLLVVLLACLPFAGVCAIAAATDDSAQIRSALTQWRDDFNTGRADRLCGLFASDLIADIRGEPERGYAAQCELLHHVFADRSRHYAYALAIKEIRIFGDVAVVRLDWTLTVNENGAGSVSVEHGMDVFARQPSGIWKIARFMVYQE